MNTRPQTAALPPDRIARRCAAGVAAILAAALPLGAAAQSADAAGAAVAASGTAVPALVTREAIANPYGLRAMLEHAGLWSVTSATLLILVLMSIGSWYLIASGLIGQSRLLRHARQTEGFWSADSVAAGAQALAPDSAFRRVAQAGLAATDSHAGPLGQEVDRNTWIAMGVQRAVESVASGQQRGLAFLATVGTTAPFVGLFGTVWGILQALTQIGVSGQASLDQIAGPVGEALYMTAIGLAVAVPAVMGHNLLIRRNRLALERVRHFAADVHRVLLGGSA